MDCTQLLPSTPSKDSLSYQRRENKIVATLTISGITHNIFNCENTIGRAESCRIVINNEAISNQHAIIEANDYEEHIIYDLGSTNKTKLGKIVLKPHVRYFINDGANVTFADTETTYKYVFKPESTKQQRINSVSIPETPEKSELSFSPFENSTIKDNEIIESSDIDMFDEPFEEEIQLKRNDAIHQSSMSSEVLNKENYGIDSPKVDLIGENNKPVYDLNEENTCVLNVSEVSLAENKTENNKSLEPGEAGKVTDFKIVDVDHTRLSIYDIPTQTLSDEGDVFEERNRTLLDAETEESQDSVQMNANENENKPIKITKVDENKEISDILDVDTLDAADYENRVTNFKERIPDREVSPKDIEEHKSINLKNRSCTNDANENFLGRCVTEISTQDLLHQIRDSDSDEDLFKTKEIFDDNEFKFGEDCSKVDKVSVLGTANDAKGQFRSYGTDKAVPDSVKKKCREWDEDAKLFCETHSNIKWDKLRSNNLTANDDKICEDSLTIRDKQGQGALEQSICDVLNQQTNSFIGKRNCNDRKEEEGEEVVNYKEKKIKMSQMMKLSNDAFLISPKNQLSRGILPSGLNSGFSEQLTHPVNNYSVNNFIEGYKKKATVISTRNVTASSSSEQNDINEVNVFQPPLLKIASSNELLSQLPQEECSSPLTEKKGKKFKKTMNFHKGPLKSQEEQHEHVSNASLSDVLTQSVLLHNEEFSEKKTERTQEKKKIISDPESAADQKDLKDMNSCSLTELPVLSSEKLLLKSEIICLMNERLVTSPPNRHEKEDKSKDVFDVDKVSSEELKDRGETGLCETSIHAALAQNGKLSYGPENEGSNIKKVIQKDGEILNSKEEKQNNSGASVSVIIPRDILTQPVLDPCEKDSCSTENEVKNIKKIIQRDKGISDEENSLGSSLQDINISEMFTQPVLPLNENRCIVEKVDYIVKKSLKMDKELLNSNNEKPTVSTNLQDLTLSDLLTQPFLSSNENQSLIENVDCGIKKRLITDKEILTSDEVKRTRTSEQDYSISDLLTQPVLPSSENQSLTENVDYDIKKKLITDKEILNSDEENSTRTSERDYSISDMLTQPVLPSSENQSLTENVDCDIETRLIMDKEILTSDEEKSTRKSEQDYSLSDLLTQPVLPPSENQSLTENVDYDIKKRLITGKKILNSFEEKSTRTSERDYSITDMLTQPFLPSSENQVLIENVTRSTRNESSINKELLISDDEKSISSNNSQDPIRSNDLLTQSVLSSNENQYLIKNVGSSNQQTLPANIKEHSNSVEESNKETNVQDITTLNEMLTQPVLSPNENQSLIKNEDINIKKLVQSDEEIFYSKGEEKSPLSTTMQDLSMSEMLTQPIVAPNKTDINENDDESIKKDVQTDKKILEAAKEEKSEGRIPPDLIVCDMETQPVTYSVGDLPQRNENAKELRDMRVKKSKFTPCKNEKIVDEEKRELSVDNMLMQTVLSSSEISSRTAVKKGTYDEKVTFSSKTKQRDKNKGFIKDSALGGLSLGNMRSLNVSPSQIAEDFRRKHKDLVGSFNASKREETDVNNGSVKEMTKPVLLRNEEKDKEELIHEQSHSVDICKDANLPRKSCKLSIEDLQPSSIVRKSSFLQNESLSSGSKLNKSACVSDKPNWLKVPEKIKESESTDPENLGVAESKSLDSVLPTKEKRMTDKSGKGFFGFSGGKNLLELEGDHLCFSHGKRSLSDSDCLQKKEQVEFMTVKDKKNVTLRLKKQPEKKPNPKTCEILKECVVPSDHKIKINSTSCSSDSISATAEFVDKEVADHSEKNDLEIDFKNSEKESKMELNKSPNDPNEKNVSRTEKTELDVPVRDEAGSLKFFSKQSYRVNTAEKEPKRECTHFTKVILDKVADKTNFLPEMGRGKRKRVKKLFEDFCTDENSKKACSSGVTDEIDELTQNLSKSLHKTNDDPVANDKLSVTSRKKSSTGNAESESQSTTKISSTRLRQKLAKNKSPEADEKSSAFSIGYLEINDRKSKLVQNSRMNKNKGDLDDSNAVSDGVSSFENNKICSYTNKIENFDEIELFQENNSCRRSWNSPLSTTQIKTYSKKKSLITVNPDLFTPNFSHFAEIKKLKSRNDGDCKVSSSVPQGLDEEKIKTRASNTEHTPSFVIPQNKNVSDVPDQIFQKCDIIASQADYKYSPPPFNRVLKRGYEEGNSESNRSKRLRKKSKEEIHKVNQKKEEETPSSNASEVIIEPSALTNLKISPIVKLERYKPTAQNTSSDHDNSRSNSSDIPVSKKRSSATTISKNIKSTCFNSTFKGETDRNTKSPNRIIRGGRDSKATSEKEISKKKNKPINLSCCDGEGLFNSESTGTSPARRSARKRKVNSRFQEWNTCEKIMFTGYNDPKAANVIKKLGGNVVECPKMCTVLVTDKVRRTVKFLCALALGRPIVSPKWLTNCKTSLSFLDHDMYLLKDKEAEKQFSFSLKDSLEKARKTRLLEGKSIFVTNSVKPPPAEMKTIVECSGGIFLPKEPTTWPQDVVIISCPEDKSKWNAFRKKNSKVPIVTAEFILSGVLQQDLHIDKYRI